MGANETPRFPLDTSGKRIVVDPVTRIEGHMRCEVNLDSRLHRYHVARSGGHPQGARPA